MSGKQLVSQVLNQQCSQTMAFVVAGFSKVYVGEIVEKGEHVRLGTRRMLTHTSLPSQRDHGRVGRQRCYPTRASARGTPKIQAR